MTNTELIHHFFPKCSASVTVCMLTVLLTSGQDRSRLLLTIWCDWIMWWANISQCQACQRLSQPHSLPFMTGVKTAMPAKFGLVTVLSRIKPPTLQGHMRVSHTQITAQFAITPNDIVQHGNRWWSAVKCDLSTGNSKFGRVGVCRWEVQTWVRLFYTVKWLTDGSTCWWPWRWWLAPNQSRAVLWWKGSSWLSAPTGGT